MTDCFKSSKFEILLLTPIGLVFDVLAPIGTIPGICPPAFCIVLCLSLGVLVVPLWFCVCFSRFFSLWAPIFLIFLGLSGQCCPHLKHVFRISFENFAVVRQIFLFVQGLFFQDYCCPSLVYGQCWTTIILKKHRAIPKASKKCNAGGLLFLFFCFFFFFFSSFSLLLFFF